MLARILLHHIMFLPFEEVVQTSVLSKRWKEARDAYPIFEFTDACHNVNRKKKKKRIHCEVYGRNFAEASYAGALRS